MVKGCKELVMYKSVAGTGVVCTEQGGKDASKHYFLFCVRIIYSFW